jgi:hypothetical protein
MKYAPAEWIRVGMSELHRAEAAYKARDISGGLACAKRAAGMALNGALVVEPNDKWGRSYVDHVIALGNDASVPQAVRDACAVLLATHVGPSDIIRLRSPRGDEKVLEAAKDVIAHAYFVVAKHEANAPDTKATDHDDEPNEDDPSHGP